MPDPEVFRTAMLRFINEVLPALDPDRAKPSEPIRAETPLFETNLLDSLSILHLIAAIEDLTGEAVPDAKVTMKHFQSVETLTRTFCDEDDTH